MTGDNHTDSREDRVNRVVAEYLEAERAGRAPNRAELLARPYRPSRSKGHNLRLTIAISTARSRRRATTWTADPGGSLGAQWEKYFPFSLPVGAAHRHHSAGKGPSTRRQSFCASSAFHSRAWSVLRA